MLSRSLLVVFRMFYWIVPLLGRFYSLFILYSLLIKIIFQWWQTPSKQRTKLPSNVIPSILSTGQVSEQCFSFTSHCPLVRLMIRRVLQTGSDHPTQHNMMRESIQSSIFRGIYLFRHPRKGGCKKQRDCTGNRHSGETWEKFRRLFS